MPSFTFRKVPKTGRYSSFDLNETEIKLNKMLVGRIYKIRDTSKYRISFVVKKEPTRKDLAKFKWITLKKICDTEPEARDFVKKHEKEIQEKYNLHSFKD